MAYNLPWLLASGYSGAYALQFPSNSAAVNTTDPYAVLEFASPQSDGLPIWGAGGAGITVVRKLKTKATLEPGYNAFMWWSRGDGTFSAGSGYWGAHPYPARGHDVANNYGPSGSGYFIQEIAIVGRDLVETNTDWGTGNNASAPTLDTGYEVTANTTYTQGLRITRNGASSKTLVYYFNLPNVGATDQISITETTANYGESDPPSPKLTIGDSPWYASYQHERADCVLDAIKIFNAVLTQQEMLDEAADFSNIKTAAGASAIWWGRNGFDTGHDTNTGTIASHYGVSRSMTIVNPSATEAQRINLVSRI
jgi:hypothetical protein